MIELQDYSCEELLYESRTAIVYRGYRNRDNLPVILKLSKQLHASSKEHSGYFAEYECLNSLVAIESAVHVIALEVQDSHPCLVFEDIGADSLSSLLKTHLFSLKEILNIFHTIANTLASVHQLRYIHLNITPSNIIYNPKTQQCRLIDFGAASQIDASSDATEQQMLDSASLPYMAPEQSGRIGLSVDCRTDLYALGICFYEMLAGVLPFPQTDALKIVHSHIATRETPLCEIKPDLPKQVSDIVSKLLNKSPDERYQTANGLCHDLATCLNMLDQGAIELFALAQYDFPETFTMPKKLYGRQKEIATLHDIYSHYVMKDKASALLLVSGYSGTGKSSLVNEIRKNRARYHGHFITGKFDQIYRHIPYYAFKQALNSLIEDWLKLDDEALETLKTNLKSTLGELTGVLFEVVPNLELIVGTQKPPPPLAGAEAQNRFNLALGRFFQAVTEEGAALILFLDDLQWADPASLSLLHNLLGNKQLKNLLFIGAYRDNETDATHPLTLMIDTLHKQKLSPHVIKLQNLSEATLQELCTDLFHTDAESIAPLAQLIHTKTLGNPFFVTQFLNSLQHDGFIGFKNGAWHWDIKKIEACNIPNDVVQLMAAKISTLMEETQRLLTLAACIGNRFDQTILSCVSNLEPDDVAAHLRPALHEGLLIMQENSQYRFSHDRIQQAAYSLATDPQSTHLFIARLLHNTDEAKGNMLFHIVNHFNEALALINDDAERVMLAKLNLSAGQAAKQGTAYNSAIKFLTTGIELLDEDIWESDYTLAYGLYSELAWCQFYAGKSEGVEAIFDLLVEHAKTRDDYINVHTIRMEYYHLCGDYTKALEIQKLALTLLGITVDDFAIDAMLQEELANVEKLLKGRNIEDLPSSPELNAAEQLAILDILMRMWTSAYLASQASLVAWSSCKMTSISLKDGNSLFTSFAYMNYAFVCVALLDNFKTGHRFGLVAITLAERYDAPLLLGKVYLLFAVFINHWRAPLSSSLEYSLKSFPLLVENGDWTYAGYCAEFIISDPTIWGMSCDKILDEANRYLPFLKNNTLVILEEFVLPSCLNPVLQLQGKTDLLHSFDNEMFKEATFLETFGNNPLALSYYQTAKLRSLYWFGYLEDALKMSENADFVASVALAQAKVPEMYFYTSLTILALNPKLDDEQKMTLLDKVSRYQEKMRLWADNSPSNFEHKYLLVEAERANIAGKHWDALTLYDAAIEDAEKNGYINNTALAYECASRFLESSGMFRLAEQYLMSAVSMYRVWGATAKAMQLEQNNHRLLSKNRLKAYHNNMTINPTDEIKNLDLHSIMQASQSLAKEVNLEKLLEQMMVIAKENAGAQRCMLLIPDKKGWTVAAKTDPISSQISVTDKKTLSTESEPLPLSLLTYCLRTKKSLIIDNASLDEHFFNDPYIADTKMKSILCIPLMHSSKTEGLLYFENSLIEGTFTPEGCHVLELLSAQMAISIVNAKFYRSLEQQVSERTSELLQVNEDLKAANSKLEALSNIDSLTQIANRRMLDTFIEKAWTNPAESSDVLSIIHCDIDFFKQFNDIYGHLRGDECLKMIAQTLHTTLQRPNNLVARYGGEEFTIVLPHVDMLKARQLVETIQTNIKKLSIPHKGSKVSEYVTLSFGVITVHPANEGIEEVLHSVDQALYGAKVNGRNKAVFLSR